MLNDHESLGDSARDAPEAGVPKHPSDGSAPLPLHDTHPDDEDNTSIGVSKGVKIFVARLAVGDKIGKYEIRALLGEGGMGAVYLAHNPLIQREVALKVLSHDVSSNPAALQRFFGEAWAVNRLTNPHVISIYDIEEWNGHYYLVMELLTGGSVADLIDKQGAIPWQQAFEIVSQAARGLAAAHAAGMVHRDIKPENLMLTGDGQVKVVDFGLAELLDEVEPPPSAEARAAQIVGTPQYMSPEQFQGDEVDARTDVYSLGATLFRLLTGRFPYHDCRTVREIMEAHLSRRLADPTEYIPALPELCGQIISCAMAKNPRDRYQSATEMATALQAALDQAANAS